MSGRDDGGGVGEMSGGNKEGGGAGRRKQI